MEIARRRECGGFEIELGAFDRVGPIVGFKICLVGEVWTQSQTQTSNPSLLDVRRGRKSSGTEVPRRREVGVGKSG